MGRWGGSTCRLTRLVTVLAVAVCGAVSAVPAAAKPASFTWSGADTTTPQPNWSDAANWAGGVAPASSSTVGTLIFPQLTSADCTSATPIGTCYVSQNDRTNVTVGQLDFNVAGGSYAISGNPITLDHGLTVGQGANPFGRVDLTLPITLGAPQTWNVDSSLSLGSYPPRRVLSGQHALTVNIANSNQFWIYSPIDVGALSVNGGQIELATSDLNSANGNRVTLTHSSLVAYGQNSVGALSILHSYLLLGFPGAGGGGRFLRAKRVTFDSGSTLGITVSGELAATGPVDLDGATLGLDPDQSHFPCDQNARGTVSTLVSSTGPLSDRFQNAPEDGTVSAGCDLYTIEYNRTGPTKTVTDTLIGAPTTTALSHSLLPVTNQAVTLTATINSPEMPGTLFGTVTFKHGAKAIRGCRAQSITFANPVYTASCTTSFAASSSPVALRAVFTPAARSPDLASTGSDSLIVAKAATSTTVVPPTRPAVVGTGVTYLATVTPAYAGPTEPKGSVEFLDNGTPIASCTSQPLQPGSSASMAICTVLSPPAGSHEITARYAGDGDFTGSASSAA